MKVAELKDANHMIEGYAFIKMLQFVGKINIYL
jgi:hypothetical protein